MIHVTLAAQIIDYKACKIISKSESHQRTSKRRNTIKEGRMKKGISVPPCKVVHNVPVDPAISTGLQNMGEKVKQSVEKQHEIAFYVALKGHPLTDFQGQIKPEKLHGVKYTGAYENESAGRDFTFCISEYFYEENLKKKLSMVNFLVVLCDGSIGKNVMEHKVVYIAYADPETVKPTLTFFEVAAPSESQCAP